MVEYQENGDLAIINEYKFRRDKKTGYYLSTRLIDKKRKRLHIYVWELINGAIPHGYDIHHIDHNKSNNEIDNLMLVTRKQHKKIHASEMTDEQRNNIKINLIENAIPASKAWHKSSEGLEWHKQHYESMKSKLHAKIIKKCEFCGKEYEATHNGANRFCSNNCKSAYRRKMGYDNIERECACCGEKFIVNKYSTAKYCQAHRREVRYNGRDRECLQYGG